MANGLPNQLDFITDTYYSLTRLLFLSTMLLSYTLVFSALVATASASNVIDLTPDNFDSIIGKGKPALVEL